MIEHLIELDKSVFLYLNNLGTPMWDGFWLAVTHNFTFVPLYAILLYLLYKNYGWKALLFFAVLIALMILFTDQITNVFKRGFERPRPCRSTDIECHVRFIAGYCGKYGFFSGHAANSMAAAIFAGLMLRNYYKKLIYVLILWSFMVSYSRIYVGVHYPLDIIIGTIFGFVAGILFYKFAQFGLKKWNLYTPKN